MRRSNRRRWLATALPLLVAAIWGVSMVRRWTLRVRTEPPTATGPRLPKGRIEPQLAVSWGFGALLDPDGGLWMWGHVPYMMATPRPDPMVPHRVAAGTNWTRLAISGQHVLLIRDDGTLWGLGANFAGQLARPNATWYDLVVLSPQTNWAGIVALEGWSLALDAQGGLWTAGATTGQSGGSITNPVLRQVVTTNRWQDLAGGWLTAFARNRDGAVDRISMSPQGPIVDRLPGGTNVAWRMVGANASCAFAGIDGAGRLLTSVGGDLAAFPVAHTAPATEHFNYVAGAEGAKWNRCVFIGSGLLAQRDDGSWWGLDWNHAGQLGLGDRTTRLRLTRLPWPKEAVALAGGGNTVAALLEDGSLWYAGQQLGVVRTGPEGPVQKAHWVITSISTALRMPGARNRSVPDVSVPTRLWTWPPDDLPAIVGGTPRTSRTDGAVESGTASAKK